MKSCFRESSSLILHPSPSAMFTVSREINFCYGHRLLNYEGKCRHLHGHNGRAVITFKAAEPGPQGMVLDFSEIKRIVSRWIDDHLDHRMILNRIDPAVPMLQEMGEPVYLMDVNPTAENIAKLIFDVALGRAFRWLTFACGRLLGVAPIIALRMRTPLAGHRPKVGRERGRG